jgi:SAM-dependent methyltransferase
MARQEGVKLALCHGSAENLPFKDKSFDFIFCSETTEHVNDPEKAMAECARVLREGGKMYASFHNRYGIYDHHYHMYFINWMPRFLADKIIDFCGKAKADSNKAGAQKLSKMNYFTYNGAVRLLKKYNFEYIDSREEQIKNPELSDKKILTIIAKLRLSGLVVFLLKKFYGTFHFIATKS